MDELRTKLEELRQRFSALSMGAKIGAIAGLLATVGMVAWAYSAGSRIDHAVLFSNLSEQDAADVVESLTEKRVPYRLEEGGHTILVPSDRVHETRLALASDGLPKGGGVGFEIFDEQRFGESEFAEQVKYHRALEGELARTIQALGGVKTARVHLVLPSRSLFSTDDNTASASVAVTLRPGGTLNESQVRGIVHLIASSVRGLKAENVTIVDGEGHSLNDDEDGASGDTANKSLAFRREVERSKERAVQAMLDATLGPGAAVVRVAADVTFAREERTEEVFDPAATAERSHQISEERDLAAGSGSTGGVPGAPSNLAGAEPPTGEAETGQGIVRRNETRNYEVSRTTRRVSEPVGRVSKLDVAVLVDYVNRGNEQRPNFQARSAQELAEIKEIVESAVGTQGDRGDRVAVRSVRFHREAEPEPPKDILKPVRPYLPLAIPALALIGVLGAAIIGYRVFRKRKTVEVAATEKLIASEAAAAATLGATSTFSTTDGAPALPDGEAGEAGDAAPKLPETAETRRDEEAATDEMLQRIHDQFITPEAEEAMQLAAQLAAQDPAMAAKVIRSWLTEGELE